MKCLLPDAKIEYRHDGRQSCDDGSELSSYVNCRERKLPDGSKFKSGSNQPNMSSLFKNTKCRTLDSYFATRGNSPAEDVAKIIQYFYSDKDSSYRQKLEIQNPNIPFESLNSADRILHYLEDIIKTGSEIFRKNRMFTVGHQGSGKTSQIHSMR